MSPFDLTRPPFRVVAQQTAADAAADILAAFAAARLLPDRLNRTFDAILLSLDASAQQPLVVAGRALAKDIDSGIGAGLGNAYHNAQHFCEVMLGCCYLALLDDLDAEGRLEVVLAAMIHDFHHDGAGNGPVPFRLERLAADESRRYLAAAGVPEKQQHDLAALVLATEVAHGLPYARACYDHHRNGQPLPTAHPVASELTRLAMGLRTSRQALILCEADVLPSVGLTTDYAMQSQARLAAEWGRPLGVQDKYQFLTKGFPGFVVGRFFQPNVEGLRSFLSAHAHDAATGRAGPGQEP